MDDVEHGHSTHGLELLCDIIRGQAACRPCPGCGQALSDIQLELEEVTVDRVALGVICRSCQTRFRATIVPASDDGVAIVR